MPKYLLQVNYSLDGVKGVMSQGGSARKAAGEAAAASVGGTLESMYFAFGDTDVFAVADLPSNCGRRSIGADAERFGRRDVPHGRAPHTGGDRPGNADQGAVHATRSMTVLLATPSKGST